MRSPYFGTRTAVVAYLVSEAQTVPQRDVLLDDSRLVCSPLMNRGQFRERLSCENKVGKISIITIWLSVLILYSPQGALFFRELL